MTTKPILVLPMTATPTEAKAFQEVCKAAFESDSLMEFTFNNPEIPKRSQEEHAADHLKQMADPLFVWHKAVDAENPNGPVLGVGVWYWVEDPHNPALNIPWGDPTLGAHLECYEATYGPLRRWRLNHFKELNQPFACMAILVIMPEAQHRGVGSALLREGLKEVDRKGWPAFIEASPKGLGLYKKFGWEEKVKTTVNPKDFGGEDAECVTVGLVRPPGAKEIIKEEAIA